MRYDSETGWREWIKILAAGAVYALALGQYFGGAIGDLRRAERDIGELKSGLAEACRNNDAFHQNVLTRLAMLESDNKNQEEDIENLQGKTK